MNTGMWSFSSVNGLLTFALFGVGIVNLFLLVQLVQRRTTGAVSRCGACNYSAEGLRSDRCPECGASVIRVGILTGRLRPGLKISHMMLVLIIASAAIVLPLANWGNSWLRSNYPVSVGVQDREFRFGPDANGLQLHMIHQTLNRRDLSTVFYPELGEYPAYAFIAPRNSARPGQLVVDRKITTETRFTSEQLGPTFVQPDGPISAPAVEEWLSAQSFPSSMDLESPEGVVYLETLRDLVVRNLDGIMNDGGAQAESPFRGASSSSGTSPSRIRRAEWVGLAYLSVTWSLVTVVLSLIVLWGIRRRAQIRSLRI